MEDHLWDKTTDSWLEDGIRKLLSGNSGLWDLQSAALVLTFSCWVFLHSGSTFFHWEISHSLIADRSHAWLQEQSERTFQAFGSAPRRGGVGEETPLALQ